MKSGFGSETSIPIFLAFSFLIIFFVIFINEIKKITKVSD